MKFIIECTSSWSKESQVNKQTFFTSLCTMYLHNYVHMSTHLTDKTRAARSALRAQCLDQGDEFLRKKMTSAHM